MFEQTFVNSKAARNNPWAVPISFVAQAIAVTACVLISAAHTDILPRTFLRIGIYPAKGTPDPPMETRPAGATQPSRRIVNDGRVFRMPQSAISPIVMGTVAMETAGPEIGGPATGIPAGIGDGIGIGSPAGAILPYTPPPPPVEARKPIAIERPPLRIGGGVQAAKLLRQVKPPYPPLARQARISGVVRLEAVIAKNGEIKNLEVISGHPLLTAAALDAVRQWSYQPTLLNGDPVEVRTVIDVNFTLAQ